MDIYFPKVKDINISECRVSQEGSYSISKPYDAFMINKIILSYFDNSTKLIITDATANNGGNTINFALTFKKVNAVEISKEQFDILVHNCNVYKLKNVKLINDDYLKQMNKLSQDVIFIDAPWGGPQYYKKKSVDLYLGEQNIIDIVKKLYENNAFKLCVLKVPKNYNFQHFFDWNPMKICIHTLRKFILICILLKN